MSFDANHHNFKDMNFPLLNSFQLFQFEEVYPNFINLIWTLSRPSYISSIFLFLNTGKSDFTPRKPI